MRPPPLSAVPSQRPVSGGVLPASAGVACALLPAARRAASAPAAATPPAITIALLGPPPEEDERTGPRAVRPGGESVLAIVTPSSRKPASVARASAEGASAAGIGRPSASRATVTTTAAHG